MGNRTLGPPTEGPVRTSVRRQVGATALGVAILLSACGGDDDDTGGDAAEGTATTTRAAAGATTTTAAAGATTTTTAAPIEDTAVPDPCTLLQPMQLGILVGGDPGPGETSAYDPEQRRICIYGTGMILAVELADHYDTAIDIIRDETGEDSVHEVTGVGKAAVWQDIGDGVGQFIAQGDDYFVGVTLLTGGQDVGRAVAEAMLAVL
jgi:hypothetical protein